MFASSGKLAEQHDCIDIDLPFLSTEDNGITTKFFSTTVGNCRQTLHEENWSVFQILIVIANGIEKRTLNPAAESLPSQAKLTEPNFIDYLPKVYPGTFVLFNTLPDSTTSFEHPQLGWKS